MKKFLTLSAMLLVFSFAAAAQDKHNDSEELNSKGEKVHRSQQNSAVELKDGETITRGSALSGKAKKVSLAKALKDPKKYEGKTVALEGVVVRSCKKEGCWMEFGSSDGKSKVRVTFGDHAFFIPLNAAGMAVKTEGKFVTKILPKEHVDHLIKDDGAKFDKINADGTVTEVSFDAIGVELSKAGK